MKKTKVWSLIAALLVAVSVMGAPTMQVEASGCGNWECYSAGTPFCKEKGCGILWLESEVHYQNMYYKRVCVEDNNKTWTDYKTELEYLGCC